jgi:16S rRNA processing protein RimM
VGKPHGIAGAVVVHSRTDDPELRFRPGAQVRTDDGRLLQVSALRTTPGATLLSFAGVVDRNAAESLRGQQLWADIELADQELDSDEYHDTQLIGLQARDAAGAVVGKVEQVLHLPAQDALAVGTASGQRIVPFVAELVPEVDLAGGYLVINTIPGLLSDPD